MNVRRFLGGLVRTKTWHDLRDLGNSRLIRTSFIWLILVPAAAKTLEPFVGEYPLSIPELGVEGKTVGIHLPPGWSAFYFMSLCFAVGQVIYYWRCPELVRQFANWGEYREAHKGNEPLIAILASELAHYERKDLERLHGRVAGTLSFATKQQKYSDDLQWLDQPVVGTTGLARMYVRVAESRGRQHDWSLSDMFAIVLEDVQCFRRGSLTLCGWSFRVGFVLFLWTALVNLWAVCRVLINQWGW